MHWAASYVGAPYAPGAEGPCAFSCWGLVRHVFRTHYGVQLAAVAVHSNDLSEANLENVAAIKRSARLSGMRPVGDVPPADGDIVLMRSTAGLHCGVVVRVNGRLQVLHAGHESGVVIEPWGEATSGMTVELWRNCT